jgi:hypothetical protein
MLPVFGQTPNDARSLVYRHSSFVTFSASAIAAK